MMNGEEKVLLIPNVIGPALAYLVSQVEGEEYVYEYVDAFRYGWISGIGSFVIGYSCKAIVKKGLETCNFCLNENSPWFHAKLAHVLRCASISDKTHEYSVGKWPVDFGQEFKSDLEAGCMFPYLDDFIRVLEEEKLTTGEMTEVRAMELAIEFGAKKVAEEGKKLNLGYDGLLQGNG